MENNDNIPANIIVAGITGTGKSTLLNAVFNENLARTGSGKPITDHVSEYYESNTPIRVWDTVGLELDSETTADSIKAIKGVISERLGNPNSADVIHAIWYCINSGSNRYQSKEVEFIKELYNTGVPFIIVLTQCDGDIEQINEFEEQIKQINIENGLEIEIVQVLAKDKNLRGGFVIKSFGLPKLVEMTIKRLPSYVKNGFIAAQNVDKSLKREKCENIIFEYAKQAIEGFWDKVAIVNVWTTDKKIESMLKDICSVYMTVVDKDSIDKALVDASVDFKHNFKFLLNPMYKNTSQQLLEYFTALEKSGFSISAKDFLEKNNRSANMIARFGYIFIQSVEETWDDWREHKLIELDTMLNSMLFRVNKRMKDWKGE